jgi:hypothetical protein
MYLIKNHSKPLFLDNAVTRKFAYANTDTRGKKLTNATVSTIAWGIIFGAGYAFTALGTAYYTGAAINMSLSLGKIGGGSSALILGLSFFARRSTGGEKGGEIEGHDYLATLSDPDPRLIFPEDTDSRPARLIEKIKVILQLV